MLLILDTLAASFPGLRGNEEDEKVRAYMRFEEMVSRSGATAGLMVSHTGHADRNREMGSVAGIGRLDNALVATRDERGQRALKVSMARDMDDSADSDIPYTVEGLPNCARAADGSLTRPAPVVVAGRQAPGPDRAGGDAPAVLELLGAVLGAPGYSDAPMGKNALFEALAGSPRRPAKARFLAALTVLEEQGLVRCRAGPNRAQYVLAAPGAGEP